MRPHNSSLILHYVEAAERNLAAFTQEFRRAVKTRQNLPDLKLALLIFTQIADQYGDLTEWCQSAPEAAWLIRDEEDTPTMP